MEKQTLTETYQREILQTQIEIQNHTLQQIGQELHDHVGQMLSLTMIQLSVLEDDLSGTAHRPAVRHAIETVERTLQDVRALSKTLDNGTVQRFGLKESLSLEMDRIRRTGRFQTQFLVAGAPYPLGEQAETVLFRMAQESLTNAMKHSGGKQLTLTAEYHADFFILIITDDGAGFNPEETSRRGAELSGSGLLNLRQRARMLGGDCLLTSRPDTGTRVEIRVPMPKAESPEDKMSGRLSENM
ncbi:sensor histidine kinase [Larkinella soli]|uniref:sensor histidine kinase n=1 Tax=Larkinella soli TaxID=1770527 RepID=UPI001E479695|nr:sensor histidine kinase [Larkinella soli]